jgi:hypothetical protein
MRLLRRIVLPLVLLVVVSPAFTADDPRITAEERARLLAYLRDSEAQFVALLDGVSDAQWEWSPSPDRWSVAQVARHILISENYLFEQAMLAMKNPADPAWAEKTAAKTPLLERVLPDRSRKVQAPEPLNPLGAGPMTRAQVLAEFTAQRARTRQFAETTQLPLREHLTRGLFPVFDPLNAYQFLLYIPLHNIRHNQQIVEVKTSTGYPAH